MPSRLLGKKEALFLPLCSLNPISSDFLDWRVKAQQPESMETNMAPLTRKAQALQQTPPHTLWATAYTSPVSLSVHTYATCTSFSVTYCCRKRHPKLVSPNDNLLYCLTVLWINWRCGLTWTFLTLGLSYTCSQMAAGVLQRLFHSCLAPQLGWLAQWGSVQTYLPPCGLPIFELPQAQWNWCSQTSYLVSSSSQH